MKIVVFGAHPGPQPGFRGVMSVYEAKWLAEHGDEVTLLLPFTDKDALATLLRNCDIDNLNELDKFGGNFQISPVFLGDPQFPEQLDVVVWQATKFGPKDEVWRRAREACTVLTTNSGKFVPAPLLPNIRFIHGRFNAFDLLGCALKEDFDLLDSEPVIKDKFAGRYCYAPRGADPDLLNPNGKATGPPVIGIDMPLNDSAKGAAHYIPALEILKERFPELEVLSVGRQLPLPFAERVDLRPYADLCADFYNRIWAYMVMDYRHSPSHITGRMSALMPDRWGTRAIYEMQNIEAQMSGAPLIAHPDNIIEELTSRNSSWFPYTSYDDPRAIADVTTSVLENIEFHRSETRRWSLANHSWQDCIDTWRSAMFNLINTGYKRP